MAKRFTDTNKWRKGFIRGLQGAYKLLWLYILDECDHAGIWHVELDVASLRIGEEIDSKKAVLNFADHIVIFDKATKWFIPDFIEFQYGTLNPDNRAHKSVLDLLEKYKLKGHLRGLQARKVKDKDMVKDINVSFVEFWDLYDKKKGSKDKCEKRWDNLKDEERSKIIETLPGFIKSISDKQFQPFPSTYLNERRWEDEVLITPEQLFTHSELCDMATEKGKHIWDDYIVHIEKQGNKPAIFKRK